MKNENNSNPILLRILIYNDNNIKTEEIQLVGLFKEMIAEASEEYKCRVKEVSISMKNVTKSSIILHDVNSFDELKHEKNIKILQSGNTVYIKQEIDQEGGG